MLHLQFIYIYYGYWKMLYNAHQIGQDEGTISEIVHNELLTGTGWFFGAVLEFRLLEHLL